MKTIITNTVLPERKFAEIRISVVQMHTSSGNVVESTSYWIWNPDSILQALLSEWRQGGAPDSFMTSDKEVVQKTLDTMGLPMPVWEKGNNNHCYRYYWPEPKDKHEN